MGEAQYTYLSDDHHFGFMVFNTLNQKINKTSIRDLKHVPDTEKAIGISFFEK